MTSGRKLKLDYELIERIELIIRSGNYAQTACEMVGIGTTTYYRWLELADKEGSPKIYREFRDAIKRAEANAEVVSVARIRQAADEGTWQAAAWYLERKHGERWGRKDKLTQEISGPNGTPVNLSIDEARKAVLAFLDEGDNGEINSGEDSTAE